MDPSDSELPRLVGCEEKISYVRFLMAWMDAAPWTAPGQIHRRLLSAVDDSNSNSINNNNNSSNGSGRPVDLSGDASFCTATSIALVQWLAGAAPRAGRPCVLIAKRALAHVMSDRGDESSALVSSSLPRAATAATSIADQMLSTVRTIEFRGTLVVLLFHGREEVRVWARETILRQLGAAEGDRAVWLIGLRLLCCIRHITSCPLDVREKGTQCIVADGLCSLFAVLAAIDARLVAVEQAQLSKQQSAHSNDNEKNPNGPVEGNMGAAAGVSSATILLLGGSMVLHWLLSAGPLCDTSDRSGSPCTALAAFVNARLGPATTLRPTTLAADTRRGLVKIFVHCLIDYARSGGAISESSMERAKDREWEREGATMCEDFMCMCGIWRVAACVDAPPTRPAGPSSLSHSHSHSLSHSIPSLVSSPPPEKAAGWMLHVLYRNAAAQVSLPAAVLSTKAISRCAPDALRLMESAAAALHLLLATLSAALPALAASQHFHGFLQAIAADCVALACGVARRSATPCIGIALLRHFLRADVLAFSRSPAPTECLRAAWDALPALLQQQKQQKQQQQQSPLGPTECAAPRDVLLHVAEALDTVLRPGQCVWILLRPLRDGPQPLGAVIVRCAERLAAAMDESMGALQRMWECDDGAAGQWLSSGSPVPRVAHALMASRDTATRRLGEALAALFLRTIGPAAQSSFRSDAANWMLRVILDDPMLAAHALQLRNPIVDAAARADGAAWVDVMCLCNWGNLSTDTLAAAWWLCALVVDVCVLEQSQRDRLLEAAVTQLPPIPDVGTDEDKDDDDDVNGEKKENHAVAKKAKDKDKQKGKEGGRESHFYSNRATRRALLDCARHLLLTLVLKSLQYAPALLTGAVLHIAGAIPPSPPLRASDGGHSFRRLLSNALVAAVQGLPPDVRATLSDYAPAWLVELMHSALQRVRDSEAAHSRRLQQYAVEEGRIAQREEEEKRRAENDDATRRANRLRRRDEMAAEREVLDAAQRGPHGTNTTTTTTTTMTTNWTKRVRVEDLPLMHAMSDSELRAPPPPRAAVSPFTSVVPPQVAQPPQALCAAAESPSPRRVDYLEALQRIAGTTDPLRRPPRIDDIIGYGRHCIAREVPNIPRRFAGREAYAAAFIPHLALELRYEVHSRFDEVIAACRTESREGRTTGKLKVLVKEDQAPVVQWVHKNAVKVVAASEAAPTAIDPTQLLFTVSTASLRHQKDESQSQQISSALSDGDVALLLLPLARVSAALPHAFRDGIIPDEWQLFGCVPQICLVRSVQPAQRSAALHLFTPSSPAPTASPRDTVLVTFLHALHAFRTAQNPFFVRRLFPLGPKISTMRAVQDISRTLFARALFEPHVEACVSRAYHKALENIFSSEWWPPVSRALVLRDRLNEWQARAVAAALFVAVPGWDAAATSPQGPQPHSGAHRDFTEQTAGAAGGLATASLPQAPSLFLIEGPPGTGKTQTIAVLTLNLLRFLPWGTRPRVLLCAPSNCAVDEVLLRVRALSALSRGAVGDVRLLRIGVRDSVAPEVLAADPPVFFDGSVDVASRSEPFGRRVGPFSGPRDTLSGSRAQLREQLLRAAHVTCSTFGSLSQLHRHDGTRYDIVIVDETSQGTEPEVLQALMLAKGRVILVGDSKQLQPTVLCRAAGDRGLRRSLLQRVLREGGGAAMLREQYRMHPDICAFPNQYFYDGQLLTNRNGLAKKCGGSNAARTGTLLLPMGLSAAPRFMFVDVPDGRMEWGAGHSVMNRAEAEAVVVQMRRLRTALQLTPEQFGPHMGIITFYRAQKDAIVQILSREERKSRLEVATVDSFQGKEKNIIFISCVRAPCAYLSSSLASGSETASLGFVDDWHRVNVALTRAKEFCVVFGNKQTFHMAAKKTEPPQDAEKDRFLQNIEDDEVQEVEGPPPEKADNDPLMLDRLVQHAEERAVGFRHSKGLNVAMKLMDRWGS